MIDNDIGGASHYICEGNSTTIYCHKLPINVTSQVMDEVRAMGDDYYIVHPDHIDDDVEIVEQRDGYTIVKTKDKENY
jgi:hypothetical protein